MPRYTQVLLTVFLILAIVTTSYRFYDDYISYWDWDWGKRKKEELARTLNANEVTDEQGRKLRTQAISYDTVLAHEEWGDWTVVPIEQTALAESVLLEPLSADNRDRIVVTATRRTSDNFSSVQYTRFTNNLVLRNAAAGSERMLFETKVGIIRVLPLINPEMPGLAVDYINGDSNADGKLDYGDSRKIRIFRFKTGDWFDVAYEGIAPSFSSFSDKSTMLRFSTNLDLNGNGEIEGNLEPSVLYEVDIASGTVHPAVSDIMTERLQAIVDGGPAE